MSKSALATMLILTSIALASCGGGGGGGEPPEDPTGRFDSARFDEHRFGE